jgi:site-specific DNA-methyltransferase (adenine-specific)
MANIDSNALRDMIRHGEVNRPVLQRIAREADVEFSSLKYSVENRLLPPEPQLQKLGGITGISSLEYRLLLGIVDASVRQILQDHATHIADLAAKASSPAERLPLPRKTFETKLGQLHHCDCMRLMQSMDSDCVDLVFADPPFNLDKIYPSGMNDDLKACEYIKWSEGWLQECIRILKPGGSLFAWNLPKWNLQLAGFLNQRLTFRHWIAVDIKYSLPIASRLYPSHYSLLYYCKGPAPRVFHPDRLPMPVCPHCSGDLRDYGGYKNKMNPSGVNLADVWTDIPPVRHAKYKRRKDANELSVKLLDRIIEMASNEGDVVFDPFGGSGTTYAVSEIKGRRWIGCEIGPIDEIVARFATLAEERTYLQRIRADLNCLFTAKILTLRQRNGLWTVESVRGNQREVQPALFSSAE